jgi:uncharacterized membrane protein YfcA
MAERSGLRGSGPEAVATTILVAAGLVLATIYLFDGRFSWQDVLAVVVLLATAGGWLGRVVRRYHSMDE